jgi:hypothetical protein
MRSSRADESRGDCASRRIADKDKKKTPKAMYCYTVLGMSPLLAVAYDALPRPASF